MENLEEGKKKRIVFHIFSIDNKKKVFLKKYWDQFWEGGWLFQKKNMNTP